MKQWSFPKPETTGLNPTHHLDKLISTRLSIPKTKEFRKGTFYLSQFIFHWSTYASLAFSSMKEFFHFEMNEPLLQATDEVANHKSSNLTQKIPRQKGHHFFLKKWANPGLFLFIFVIFSIQFQ